LILVRRTFPVAGALIGGTITVRPHLIFVRATTLIVSRATLIVSRAAWVITGAALIVAAFRLCRHRLPGTVAALHVRIVALGIAAIVPIVAVLRRWLLIDVIGNIVRIRINRRIIEVPTAIRPPPPAEAAIMPAVPPSSVAPDCPFARSKLRKPPTKMGTEGIYPNRYAAWNGTHPHAGWYAVESVYMNWGGAVRRRHAHPRVHIILSKRRTRGSKRAAKQKAREYRP